jgi:hypothetical protein
VIAVAALTELEALARRAQRLATWAEGDDTVVPAIPDLLDFLTEQHRRPSRPSIRGQPAD